MTGGGPRTSWHLGDAPSVKPGRLDPILTEWQAVFRDWYPAGDFPVNTQVVINGLADPRAVVEIEAVPPPWSEPGLPRETQPIAPASAMFSSMSRFISTAYSIGNSFTIGSMNPATTMDVA